MLDDGAKQLIRLFYCRANKIAQLGRAFRPTPQEIHFFEDAN
ncbi:hypothetical protein GXM_06088 [Nostoc sphaeroides CCNUC1]|uniref:Uncharacterized protein n=1 Tax=Nostoc sphaeroides CCNUC1 TaxID=2653204 RepID=A0A5P8W7F8_9NOSO|nr:hypothetical protein GXM_06088 [Nostoc sphaeroides CCNUC1]